VFMLASIVIVGIFFVYGYFARLVRNVIDGVQYPLPSWDDLGDYFMEGLRLFAVCMVYLMPMIGLAMMFIFPAMLAEVTNNETFRDASDVMTSCLACVMAPVGLRRRILVRADVPPLTQTLKRDTAIVAATLAAIATAILSASLACTWLIAHGASMRWRLPFHLLCHGIPERCLHIWGVPMPI